MVDKKLFSLDFIDNYFKAQNLRSCDGDRPSTVSGISLTLNDSNLYQHGKMVHMKLYFIIFRIIFIFIRILKLYIFGMILNYFFILSLNPCIHVSAAMLMWTFARFLPLVIGHLIPEDDDHWENFYVFLISWISCLHAT